MSTAFRSVPRPRRHPSARRSPLYPVPAKQSSVRSVSKDSRTPLRAVSTPTPRAIGSKAVKRLPSTRSLPLWLRLLIQAQRGSLVIAFILVTATLLVYGSTVYTQQLWSKEYRKLKTLQRNEREMIATSASLENQLALQAERPGSGLVPQTPDSTIFLQPAPQRQSSTASPGVASPGVASPGVASPGVASPGVASPGVVSPGVPSVEAPNTPLGY